MWFRIRRENNFVKGPELIFVKMQFVMEQPEEIQEIVKPVIQRNSWFAESGIMLCSLLSSDDSGIRDLGVKLITKAREKKQKVKQKVLQGIRKLHVPQLNWEAQTWEDITDIQNLTIFEPSLS